jgi:hypothetical protein
MPGANAVWKSALSRASYPRASRGTRRSTYRDNSSNMKLAQGAAGNVHLATTGPGSSAPMPTAKAEARQAPYRGNSSVLPPK